MKLLKRLRLAFLVVHLKAKVRREKARNARLLRSINK